VKNHVVRTVDRLTMLLIIKYCYLLFYFHHYYYYYFKGVCTHIEWLLPLLFFYFNKQFLTLLFFGLILKVYSALYDDQEGLDCIYSYLLQDLYAYKNQRLLLQIFTAQNKMKYSNSIRSIEV
jgi:hypothetical protein